jgi:hypothetical protein
LTLLLLFVVPAIVSTLVMLIAFGRGRGRAAFLTLIFAALVSVYVIAYATADRTAEHSSCSDCTQFLGRYWEPDLVTFLALIAVVGAAAGAALAAGAQLLRRRR